MSHQWTIRVEHGIMIQPEFFYTFLNQVMNMYFWGKTQSERIDRMQADLTSVIEQGIAESKLAGACVGVYCGGKPLYEAALGHADRERSLPMKKDTIFRMFSMTKPVTAMAVMQLWEHGKLDLTDPLEWYFPEYQNMMVAESETLVPAQRKVTIQDLLNMTSGIPYPDCWNLSQKKMALFYDEIQARLETDHPVDTQEFCRRAGSVPLMFQPGEKWAYGASADVLGGVVEAVSGMPFDVYLKQNIFEPLGMTDTDFYVPTEKQGRFAQLYTWDTENGGIRIEPDPHLGMNDYRTKPAFLSGGAGLVSTLSDYAAFSNVLACGGCHPQLGVCLLGERTWKYMQTPQLNAQQKQSVEWDSLVGHSYGNLMRVLEEPAAFLTNAPAGEFGWDGWTGTYMTVCPEHQLSIVYLIQNCGAGISDIVRKIRTIVYGAVG